MVNLSHSSQTNSCLSVPNHHQNEIRISNNTQLNALTKCAPLAISNVDVLFQIRISTYKNGELFLSVFAVILYCFYTFFYGFFSGFSLIFWRFFIVFTLQKPSLHDLFMQTFQASP